MDNQSLTKRNSMVSGNYGETYSVKMHNNKASNNNQNGTVTGTLTLKQSKRSLEQSSELLATYGGHENAAKQDEQSATIKISRQDKRNSQAHKNERMNNTLNGSKQSKMVSPITKPLFKTSHASPLPSVPVKHLTKWTPPIKRHLI